MEYKLPVNMEKIIKQTEDCHTPEDSIILGVLSLDMVLCFLKELHLDGSFDDGRTWKFEISALIDLTDDGSDEVKK